MSVKEISQKLDIKPSIEKSLEVLSERNREILSLRHGINQKNGEKQTLESIGSQYGITRERVRQIAEASVVKIKNSEKFELIQPSIDNVVDFLRKNGGVVTEEYLLNSLVDEKQKPHLSLLLELSSDSFVKIKENDDLNTGWAINQESADAVKKLLERTQKDIKKIGRSVSKDTLLGLLKNGSSSVVEVSEENMRVLLGLSKKIQQGPFGDWGLAEWAEINPRGVRDKVYLALNKEGKPMHFRELAKKIDNGPFNTNGKKTTHPQTVHNELIKDDRFVLIGRGVYALREWGYIPGTVKDVIMYLLKEAGGPMHKEELIVRVMEQRKVQKNTILLNLQNRKHFQKKDDNTYHLS